MVELIRYTVIGGLIGLAVYEISSLRIKIDFLIRSRSSIESQIRELRLDMYDKDWMELNWEKTQARKEYEEKIEQIERVSKMQKGE